MRLSEILSRKDAEDQFQRLIGPRTPKLPAVVEPQTKVHTIRREEPVQSNPEDVFAINRRLDQKLKIINKLKAKLEAYRPRVMSIAREFNHKLPSDFLTVDVEKYLYWDKEHPDNRSMEQRHDDLIQALQDKVDQVKMYLKYPNRYQYS